MAKPIKLTPVLIGHDAVVFFDKLQENSTKKMDKNMLSSIREDAHKLQAIAKAS